MVVSKISASIKRNSVNGELSSHLESSSYVTCLEESIKMVIYVFTYCTYLSVERNYGREVEGSVVHAASFSRLLFKQEGVNNNTRTSTCI